MEETRFVGIIQIETSPYELLGSSGETGSRWRGTPLLTQYAEADLQRLSEELNEAYDELTERVQ